MKTIITALLQLLVLVLPSKPTSGKLRKLTSNHAFGISINLNADDGSLGALVAPVAVVFEEMGFKSGKAFGDPMHF